MSALAGLGAERGRALAPFTSLKVGGAADWFLPARDWEMAVCALRVAAQEGLPVLVLGGGSNLLVASSGVAGLVLKPSWGGFDGRSLAPPTEQHVYLLRRETARQSRQKIDKKNVEKKPLW